MSTALPPRASGLVARQEFRIRLRTGRWRWLLLGWVVLLAAFTVLLDLSRRTSYGFAGNDGAAACRCSAS